MRKNLAELVREGARQETAPRLQVVDGKVVDDRTEWPEPLPLPSGMAPVEPFDDLLLPDPLRPWLNDIAERIQCPPDFPAIAATVALATLIGRRCGIRPQQHDDWTVVPNLWSVVVGRPGILKTPAVMQALAPLRKLEVEAARAHDDALRLWEAECLVQNVEAGLRKKSVEKQLKGGASAAALAAELAAHGEPEKPGRRRYLVNETTVEKLGEILSANPQGVLLFRDELSGFLRGMEREGREADRAFYLEAWNGDGRFTYDRIGRGTVDIEALAVSVLGCIQPGPLREYMRAASEGGDDGFIQRFQLAVWPDVSAEWKHVDRWPDSEARGRAYEVFAQLAEMGPSTIGAELDRFDPDGCIPFLRFAPAAQEAFNGWRADLEHRVRSGEEHPAVESHLAKYRSLVPSLALIRHLADGMGGPVGEVAVLSAIAWAQYLESHARRMYAPLTGADTLPARALAKRITDGTLADGFTAREVQRKQWGALTGPQDVKQAIELLEDLQWIRAEHVPPGDKGGRPSMRYAINPRLEVAR